jgi:hypothetical protein
LSCLTGDERGEFALKAINQDNNNVLDTKSSKVNLNAYPNPNNGLFQVMIDNPQENSVLELYDFTG